MKPKPFSALNHFTVPSATCAPTFVRADDPSRSRGRGLALPPANTNVGREPRGTVQELVSQVTGHAHRSPEGVVTRVAPPGQAIRPASRSDLSDGCTWWEGPTTGSSGSRVLRPSPVLRT